MEKYPAVRYAHYRIEMRKFVLYYFCAFEHRSMGFGSALSKSFGNSFFKISRPVEWNELFF